MGVLFDIRGNLQATSIVNLSQAEAEYIFVKPFDRASKRHLLFEEYKRYTHDLRTLLGQPFYQWIDGGFISNTHSPNDIDLVCFIDYGVYHEKERAIDAHFSKWAVAKHYVSLDAFTVWVIQLSISIRRYFRQIALTGMIGLGILATIGTENDSPKVLYG